jgi:hypothetical protein
MRRIEIIRERTVRLTFRGNNALFCQVCCRAPELGSVAEAVTRTRLSLEDVESAIASGLLQVWTVGETRLVCLRCMYRI